MGLLLEYVWAFKYAEGVEEGINVHADAASVNVNMWITSDDDNLDLRSGGLVIYDAGAAGTNLTPIQYQTPSSHTLELLENTGYRNVTVPYRQNRAVIFESMRFHQTQPFSFRPGARSRRINLTFLFGHPGVQCPRRLKP